MGDYLIVSNSRHLSYIDVSKIVYVTLNNGYQSSIYMEKGMHKGKEDIPYTITMSLIELNRHFDEQLSHKVRSCLVRVGSSLMINTNYLTEIDLKNCELVLRGYEQLIRLKASHEALVSFKEQIEKSLKNSKYKKRKN